MWAAVKIEAHGKGLEQERAPLAVVLVVDVSGSMAGEPLQHVLRSCEIVADLLDTRDRLAIVTFSTNAGVRTGLTACDADGKDHVRKVVRDITTDGSTNIHGGLEVGAGVLVTAPAGLRRAMVLMSDGKPNVGIAAATGLAKIAASLQVAVSTLGFGLHHDDAVLDAIATAGSGRYAYVPDPLLARVDVARAALAHAGVVADHLELAIALADGVELVSVAPPCQLRMGGGGVKTALGDVFVDEGRAIALELRLDLGPRATGELATISVDGTSPDGNRHRDSVPLRVDVHAGPHAIDRDAQREVVLIQAELARVEARVQLDRGAAPGAAAILRAMVARIDATDGFVANDGSPLAEMREQLVDEATSYEQRATDAERSHYMKGAREYKAGTPLARDRQAPPIAAELVNVADAIRFVLTTITNIGRTRDSEICLGSNVSKRHARITWVGDKLVLQDLGSTNGSYVNGQRVRTQTLAAGDLLRFGDHEFKLVIR